VCFGAQGKSDLHSCPSSSENRCALLRDMHQMTRHAANAIEDYVTQTVTRESKVAADLRKKTMGVPHGGMITPPDTAALLALLVRMIGARSAIEVGTFTGYGSLAIASALPKNGK